MWQLSLGRGTFICADCFNVFGQIPAGSVDMVLCDLPYGTTQNKWDSVLSLEPLWREYRRVSRGPQVLTAAQPFTSALVMSALADFRYEWIWRKAPTGALNAKKRPMVAHESILIFGTLGVYNPQGLIPTVRPRGLGDVSKSKNYGRTGSKPTYIQTETGYPQSVLDVVDADHTVRIHPTQKPVALFEYLIKTYTNEGDLVLDNCAGSGTTAIAAERCGRRWICIEKDETYAAQAIARIALEVVG